MSIFGRILSKIFPGNHPAVQAGGAGTTSTAPTASAGTAVTPGATPAPATAGPSGPATAAAPKAATATPAAAAPVDVEAVLKDLAAKNPGPANWRTSIVDLMKLLQLDSDLASRKELAKELGYGGDMNDSATMNIWLHKQVMNKLAANGGKVPADMRD
jgi:hypothetical protein